jgi:hypothetical protein
MWRRARRIHWDFIESLVNAQEKNMQINILSYVLIVSALFCEAQTPQNSRVKDGDLFVGEDTIKNAPSTQPAAPSQQKAGLRIAACLGVSHLSYNWLQIGYFDYFAKPYDVFNRGLDPAFTIDIRIMMPSNTKFFPFISLFYSISQVSENSDFTFYDHDALLNDTVILYTERLRRSLTISHVGIGAGVSLELYSFKSLRIALDPDILFIYGWSNFYLDKNNLTFVSYKGKLYPVGDITGNTVAPDYCLGACARSALDVSLPLSQHIVLQLQSNVGIQWTNTMRNGEEGLWKVIGNDGREREIRLNSLLTGVILGIQYLF